MTVLARKRSLSRMEFFIKAQAIYAETARLAHKESVVPKSYRFTFGVPMCNAALSMVENIERSDAFYPNTSWGVIERAGEACGNGRRRAEAAQRRRREHQRAQPPAGTP